MQVDRGMPAGVVHPVALHAHMLRPLLELPEDLQRVRHFLFAPHDSDQLLHPLLQLFLDLIGRLAVARIALERRQRPLPQCLDLFLVNRDRAILLGELGGILAGPLAEDQQVGQRIAAQTVGAMQSGGGFAGGKQTRHIGHLGIAVNPHPTHHVMGGGTDLHRHLGDIDVRQLHELMVHAGQLFA